MEIRLDPITQQPTVLAELRANRPHFGKSKPVHPPLSQHRISQADSATNPFAPGNEHITGPEVWADSDNPERQPNDPDWKVRVIPNKYPISKHHEVVIFSPHQKNDLAAMSLKQAERVIRAFIVRGKELEKHGQPFLFCNHGPAAGASVSHPHAQILTFPTLPPTTRLEADVLAAHYKKNGNCAHCQLVEQEERVGQRMVWQNENYVLFCPEASGWPYALTIMPKIHQASFTAVKDQQVADFALALRMAISLYKKALANPSYNFWIHSAKGHFYHWHLDIIPRVKVFGGVEAGAGILVNDMKSPEDAAKEFRQTLKKLK